MAPSFYLCLKDDRLILELNRIIRCFYKWLSRESWLYLCNLKCLRFTSLFRVTELNKFNFFNLLVEDPRGPGPENQRSSEKSSVFGSRPSTLKYLDYGGGKGDITNSIAKYLNLSKENVFVTDIKDWFGNKIAVSPENSVIGL